MSLRSLIGTRSFYHRIYLIAFPIMLQQGITNLVGFLDNLMVGQLNQSSIDGVAIANQLVFVVTFALMGALAGAGIFLAQYFGAKDDQGVRHSFQIKIIFGAIIAVLFIIVYLVFGKAIVSSYLPGQDEAIREAMNYLHIMIIGIVPLFFIQLYGTSLREIGHTKVPMYAGISSIIINLTLNYLLIFGHAGFPALGVTGAAIATLIARAIEASILIIVSHHRKYAFAYRCYRSFQIELALLKRVLKKGIPLFLNELLWTTGNSMLIYAYSTRAGGTIAALTISSAVTNLFYITFAGLAAGVAVMVGIELGANRLKEAYDNAWRLIAFGTFFAACSGVILALIAPFLPHLYNVSPDVRTLATGFMWVCAVSLPLFVFNTGCFFVLRAGGSTLATFLYDSIFLWIVSVTLALLLTTRTTLPILAVYLIVQMADVLKTYVGYHMVKRKGWIRNLTLNKQI